MFNTINIDFFDELKKDQSDISEYDNKCLISQTVLTDNSITLDCNHTFNYIPLYKEVVKQKIKLNKFETTHLKLNELKCPYCRAINKQLLPFIDLPGIIMIKGINSPKKFCMKLYSCEWIYKTGKNKNTSCNKCAIKTNFGNFCKKHHTFFTKKPLSINDYNISSLKIILKSLNLKVSGKKSELINRLLNVNYQINNNLNIIK